jgi:predicted porin
MQRQIFAGAFLSLCFEHAPFAQMTVTAPIDYTSSAVTLYGDVDIGPTYVSNVGGKSKFFLDSSTAKADRIGFLGRENLGSGLSAVFRLETEFFMNGQPQLNGSKNPGFTGQDFVGISDEKLGTVTMGRQFDVINDTAQFSSIVFGGIYSSHHASAELTGKDTDNSIKYQTQEWSGLRFTAMYGFTDPTNGFGHSVQTSVAYHYGNFSGAIAYQQTADVTESPYTNWGLTRFLGMPITPTTPGVVLDRLTVYGIGGGYDIGPVRLLAQIVDLTMKKGNSFASMPTYNGGIIYRFSSFASIGLAAERSSLGSACWTQYSLGGAYALSKTTLLNAFVVFQRASGTAAFANQQTIGNSSTKDQLTTHFGITKYF